MPRFAWVPKKYTEGPVLNLVYHSFNNVIFYLAQTRGVDLQWEFPQNPRYQVSDLDLSVEIPPGSRSHSYILKKSLTINKLLKEDENTTVSCIVTKKSPKGLKRSDPAVKKIGYIRRDEKEPFFGNVKFHGSHELNLDSSRFLGIVVAIEKRIILNQ